MMVKKRFDSVRFAIFPKNVITPSPSDSTGSILVLFLIQSRARLYMAVHFCSKIDGIFIVP